MKKALVVDNHPLMLKFMNELLEKHGYQVFTAPDGLSALDFLETDIPDVIFLDLIMPQISGEMLCRIIRKRPKLRNIYVVIVSGIAAEESVDYVAFGADACIAKGPFNKMADHVLSVLNHFHQLGSRAPLIRIVGAEDLYERHTTTELLISKRHYEAVIDNIREGILELTTEGRIIYANPTATDLIGLSEDELLGSSFVQFLPPKAIG